MDAPFWFPANKTHFLQNIIRFETLNFFLHKQVMLRQNAIHFDKGESVSQAEILMGSFFDVIPIKGLPET